MKPLFLLSLLFLSLSLFSAEIIGKVVGYTLFYFAQTFWLRRILEADFISLRPGSLGARGVNASLPQAPSLAAEVAHRYGARVILF